MTFSWTEPKVDMSINHLSYKWANLDLTIEADRLTDAGQAELWFYHNNGSGERLLHIAKVNLLASSTMTQLGKRMLSHSEDIPWTQVLTYITKTAMEYQRQGEPSVLLQPVSAEELKPVFFVEPVILKGVPNVIFGEKGVNKTTLALTMLGLLQTGFNESPCGLIPSGPVKVAMLDWEGTQDLTNYTLARLIEGATIPYFELAYLRCKQPLADDISRIANFLHDVQKQDETPVSVILIDSLGQAAGSDRYDSAGKTSALRFFECLRQLNLTSLIIGQTAKDEERKRTIYGSTYFTYYSRNIMELKSKSDDLDETTTHLALFHHESNYTQKYAPLGFSVAYTPTTIKLASEPVSLSQFLERASQTKALLELLKTGAHSRQSISQGLGISSNHVSVLLNRLSKRGIIVNLGSGMWGVALQEQDTDGGS